MADQRVALVTGASRGIGRAVALALADWDYKVALLARDAGTLEAVANTLESDCLLLPWDLCVMEGLPDVVEECVHQYGKLDILVNCAGTYTAGSLVDADLNEWDRSFDLNFRSMMHLTRHALPYILKSGAGAIINIASVAGKQGFGGNGAYCGAKAAVLGFTQSLFEEVRDRGVKVCAICPGVVNTGMTANLGWNQAKMLQPEDVAFTVLWVLDFPGTGCPTEIILKPQLNPALGG